MRGTWRNTPGVAIGTTAPVWMIPALPEEQPVAGGMRSMTVTRCPSRCSHKALQMPIDPAPITVKWLISRLDVDAFHPLAEPHQKFVRDRPRLGRDVFRSKLIAAMRAVKQDLGAAFDLR